MDEVVPRQRDGGRVVLPADAQERYNYLVRVLEQHLALVRETPLTTYLVEETLNSFEVLAALVEPLKVPHYDLRTSEGRLMSAIAQLNRQIPGVALRTLWHLHEYLATSDDDGVRTREKALGIIQDLGLRSDDEEGSSGAWKALVRLFPPLP